jgi:hypothetical protein
MGGGFGAAIGGFSGSPTVEANTFTGNSCDSQYLSGVLSFVNSSSPRIFNNLIYDNPCRAINMTLPSDAAPLVYNNTIARNRTGIYIDHRVSNSAQSFRNNLIASSDIGLEVAFESTLFDAVWTNNLLFGNTANFSGTPDSTGTHGNVNGDPRLRNAAGGDFHLCPGSAAIDAGIAGSITLPPTDLEGQSRVQDGNGDGLPVVDIGAFEAAPPGPLSLQCAISRKVHGSITFDMQLELVPTNPSTDPRNGPTQTILLTFSKPVAAATVNITEGTATAGVPTFSGNDVVVNLTGVADRQYVTISLTNVAEVGGGAAASGALRIGFLAGDVNQNRVVTLADLARVNAQLSQPVSWSNFLKDVNVSGTLTLSDKGMTNANLTRALPAP